MAQFQLRYPRWQDSRITRYVHRIYWQLNLCLAAIDRILHLVWTQIQEKDKKQGTTKPYKKKK